MLQQIYRQRKNVVVHGKINNEIGGAVASICLMIKKEILIRNVQTVVFLAKHKDPPENLTKVLQQIC